MNDRPIIIANDRLIIIAARVTPHDTEEVDEPRMLGAVVELLDRIGETSAIAIVNREYETDTEAFLEAIYEGRSDGLVSAHDYTHLTGLGIPPEDANQIVTVHTEGVRTANPDDHQAPPAA